MLKEAMLLNIIEMFSQVSSVQLNSLTCSLTFSFLQNSGQMYCFINGKEKKNVITVIIFTFVPKYISEGFRPTRETLTKPLDFKDVILFVAVTSRLLLPFPCIKKLVTFTVLEYFVFSNKGTCTFTYIGHNVNTFVPGSGVGGSSQHNGTHLKEFINSLCRG